MNKIDKIFIIGKRSILSKALNNSIKNSIVFSSKDLKPLEDSLKNFKKVDIIYNTAFKSSLLNQDNSDPIEYSNYSIHFLAEFISICIQNKENIRSIIFTSSCSLYGEKEKANENDEIKITNLYGALKASSEMMLKKFLKKSEINLIIIRLFNMYSNDDNFSIISKIINSLKKDTYLNLFNKGEGIRDFIHIDDVVNIYRLILESNFNGTLNIASGTGVSIKKIINVAEESSNRKLKIINNSISDAKICTGSTKLLCKEFKVNNFINVLDFIRNETKK